MEELYHSAQGGPVPWSFRPDETVSREPLKQQRDTLRVTGAQELCKHHPMIADWFALRRCRPTDGRRFLLITEVENVPRWDRSPLLATTSRKQWLVYLALSEEAEPVCRLF